MQFLFSWENFSGIYFAVKDFKFSFFLERINGTIHFSVTYRSKPDPYKSHQTNEECRQGSCIFRMYPHINLVLLNHIRILAYA